MFSNGAQHLGHQINHGLHIPHARVRAALGEAVILTQRLQFAVARRHWIEQPLRQTQRAEPRTPDQRNAQSFPLRYQHFIQIVRQIIRHQRQLADILRKFPVNHQRRFAIPFQNLARVPMHPRSLRRNILILIQQLPKRLPIRHPPAHPLRRQLHNKNRRMKTGGFGVEEYPRCVVHDGFG